eukprot:3109894-Pyramimonas_sp.AAC.1
MGARRKILRRFREMLPRNKGRIGQIYTAGVSPAATFGPAIAGMGDKEMREAQKWLTSHRIIEASLFMPSLLWRATQSGGRESPRPCTGRT